MDWLRRRRIDRTFLIWVVLFLLILPVLIGLTLFTGIAPGSGDMTTVVGYSLIAFIFAAGISILYMIFIGLPITLLMWIAVFAQSRQLGLSPRACATLSAAIASIGAIIPVGLLFGGASASRSIGVTIMLGLVPCIVSVIYFGIAYRKTTWEDLD